MELLYMKFLFFTFLILVLLAFNNTSADAAAVLPLQVKPPVAKNIPSDLPTKSLVKYNMTYKQYADQTIYMPDGTAVKYNESGRIESEFDVNGEEIRHIFYDSDCSIMDIADFEYDSRGNQIRCISHKTDGRVAGFYDEEYDANGKMIRGIFYNSDGKVDSYFYDCIYGANGKEILRIFYNSDGVLKSYCVYTYDTNGNKIDETIYNPDGTIKRDFVPIDWDSI